MIRTISLPSSDFVGRLVGGLLDKEVTAEKVPDLAVSPQLPGIVGVYVTDDGRVAALCVLDLGLAAAMGCALTLIPPATAAAVASSGTVPDHVMENLREILNVAARLFNSPRSPHVALDELYQTPGMLPGDATGVLLRPAGRLHVAVGVPGYGGGTVTLLST